MADPSKRAIEQDWVRMFIRMRGEIYKCSCGEVYFADPANPNACPSCKKTNAFPFYIKTYRYNVPVHQRTKLYTCHTEKDSEDFTTIAGEIVASAAANAADDTFKLKNVSGKNWSITEGESVITIAPDADVELKKNMVINFGGGTAEII
jgi:hypothetical protein